MAAGENLLTASANFATEERRQRRIAYLFPIDTFVTKIYKSYFSIYLIKLYAHVL